MLTYNISEKFNYFVTKIVAATWSGKNFFENIFEVLRSVNTVRFSVIQTLLLKFEGVLSIPYNTLTYQRGNQF